MCPVVINVVRKFSFFVCNNEICYKRGCMPSWFFCFFCFLLSTIVLSQWDFSHRKFRLLSQGKASCDSCFTQPMVHAGCFSVSIIHRTLKWTTGSLMYTQMLMHAIAHRKCTDTVRKSALKVDSGRKIPCCTGELNLCQQCAGQMLY